MDEWKRTVQTESGRGLVLVTAWLDLRLGETCLSALGPPPSAGFQFRCSTGLGPDKTDPPQGGTEAPFQGERWPVERFLPSPYSLQSEEVSPSPSFPLHLRQRTG